jgi:hypothetical protein
MLNRPTRRLVEIFAPEVLQNSAQIFTPKGFQDSAQGFNPGNLSPRGTRPESGARSSLLTTRRESAIVLGLRRWIHPKTSRPFRANCLIGWFPGLTPWAEPSSPFGAKNAGLNLSRFAFATPMRVAGVERSACRNSVQLISILCDLSGLCAMLSPSLHSRTKAPSNFVPSL